MEGDVRQLEQDSIDQGFQGHVGGGVGKLDQPPLLFWWSVHALLLHTGGSEGIARRR